MTTDPTPLQESIARTVWEVCAEPFAPTISRANANEVAVSILPIIAAEVCKAQADAWDEGRASGWDNAREESDQHGGVCDMWKPHVWLTLNPYREQED